MPIGLNPRMGMPGQMNRPMGQPGQMNRPMGQPGMMNPKITIPQQANPLQPNAPRANPNPKQLAPRPVTPPKYKDPGLLNEFLPDNYGQQYDSPYQAWYDDEMSYLHRTKPSPNGSGPDWEYGKQVWENDMKRLQEYKKRNPGIREWTPPPPKPPPAPPKPPKGTPQIPGYNQPILPQYRYPEQLNRQQGQPDWWWASMQQTPANPAWSLDAIYGKGYTQRQFPALQGLIG